MRTTVAVLRGGPSREYDISLKTGASVLDALDKDKYEPRDIFIDKIGQWHVYGAPVTPERALRGSDVAFNAMHGQYGEDGSVQRVLEALGVPYTGSDALASALAFNKQQTRENARALGIKVPYAVAVEQSSDPEGVAFELFRTFPHPAIVKPTNGGSSIGVTLADNFNALAYGLEQAWEVAPVAIVEEYIKGREATVGVIEKFRNEKLYTLMPMEIIPAKESKFFDYDAKYNGKSTERVPAHFSQDIKQELSDLARKIHEGLNLAHYSRSDFITSKRGVYFLEVNTLPDLASSRRFTAMLQAVGARLSDFLDHVITLARRPRIE